MVLISFNTHAYALKGVQVLGEPKRVGTVLEQSNYARDIAAVFVTRGWVIVQMDWIPMLPKNAVNGFRESCCEFRFHSARDITPNSGEAQTSSSPHPMNPAFSRASSA